jgi:hypothetical protein
MMDPIKKGDTVLVNRLLWLVMEDACNQQTMDPPPPTLEQGGIPGWGIVHGFKAERLGVIKFIATSEVKAIGTQVAGVKRLGRCRWRKSSR